MRPLGKKGEITMRAIHYKIFNKETKKVIYTNISYSKCIKKFNEMENKEKFEIRYKWISL